MTIAKNELGQSEIPGPKHNPRVVEYLKTTGSWWNSDEIPWCSGFCNWAISKSGIKGTNSAKALSWSDWGQALSKPSYGAIAVIDYGKGKGHVGFVAGKNSTGKIVLLGGNQSNRVKYSVFSSNKIKSYIYPSGHDPSYIVPIMELTGGSASYKSTR